MEVVRLITIKVSELMGRYRMTQKQLSDQTGIRPNTVSAYWHGTVQRVDVEHMGRLCKALNCQPGDIFEYVPDQDPSVR